jgi:hypothetical protein
MLIEYDFLDIDPISFQILCIAVLFTRSALLAIMEISTSALSKEADRVLLWATEHMKPIYMMEEQNF